MPETNARRKDSELQAAVGDPDPELESLIAPQGYRAELVDDVATMETPAQQRSKAIRFMVISLVLVAIAFWLCTPPNLTIPKFSPAPYGIDKRPPPPANKFLEDVIPNQVGDFKRVDLKKEQLFEAPFVGAVVLQATYMNNLGQPASVVMIQADSYINARRYLENYKKLLQEEATLVEWQEHLYIEDNHIQWSAPDFAGRAYGLAWNNGPYFVAVTSPIKAAQQALAAEFPY